MPFYSWLKYEWQLERAVTGVPAAVWLLRLLVATQQGRVIEYWNSRPNLDAARGYLDDYTQRRIGQFTDV
jgi:hypothetical protein